LAEAFPESGLQIGLWLSGGQGCRDIVSGVLDDEIYRLFDFVQSGLPESVPKVFLRVGYEFDNPWFGYSDNPAVYREAFRKLVRACETQMTVNLCHEKIAFVWHSWAAPRKIDTSLDQFYPGDYFVDWVGVSIFQQLYPWANDEKKSENEGNFAGGNILEVKEVLEFAKTRNKPVMIAESAPFGGINVTESSIAKEYIDDNNIWNLWFQKTIDLIDEYDIAMWSYIDCDWGSQPMWKGIGFGDTRLSSSDVVMSHWWDQVLNKNSRFLLHIEGCDEKSFPSGIEDKNEGSLVSQEIAASRSSALTAVVGMKNNDRRTNSFRLTGQLSCLLCVGALAILILRRMRLTRSTKQCHSIEIASSQTFDVPNTNNQSRSVYGSFE